MNIDLIGICLTVIATIGLIIHELWHERGDNKKEAGFPETRRRR